MEKAAKVLAVVIVIQLLLVSIGIFSNLHHDRWYFSGENRPIEYIETPEPLEPRDHTISQVEDLFIAFDYDGEPDEMTVYGKFTKLPGMKLPVVLVFEMKFFHI